jgi:WD40 repeat protein
MVHYKLNFTINAPSESTRFVEFSPTGRFLAVGDESSLHVLDRVAGFHPIISSTTFGEPTALAWETSKTFYVGLNNGIFIHYQIDLGEKVLVRGAVNTLFRGAFPVTAITLDADSKTLVLSVGPGVFAFRRIHGTSTFFCC